MPLTASQRNIPLTQTQGMNNSSYGGPSSSTKTANIHGGLDIMETTRIYISGFAARMWSSISVETLRPLPVFLGVSGSNFCMSPEAFTPPIKRVIDKSTPEKISSRIRLNLTYFLTNYALVAFGVAVVVALMHPGMIFSLGMVWVLWWGHNYLVHTEVVLFGHNISVLVSIAHRFYFLFLVSVGVVMWKCFKPALIFMTITGFIISAHALMRDPHHVAKHGSVVRHGGSSDSEEEDNVMVDRPKSDV